MSYNKYINFYIYFAWILLWASLGSNPNDFYNITKIDINDFGNRSFQIQIINFFRFVAPLICLLINIFFFKKKIFTSKINFLILLLILFQIFQVIGNIVGIYGLLISVCLSCVLSGERSLSSSGCRK